MERIKLSKECKQLFLAISKNQHCDITKEQYNAFIILKRHGLVKGEELIGDKFTNATITEQGRIYLSQNPKLNNPFNWDRLISVIALVFAGISLIVSIVK